MHEIKLFVVCTVKWVNSSYVIVQYTLYGVQCYSFWHFTGLQTKAQIFLGEGHNVVL